MISQPHPCLSTRRSLLGRLRNWEDQQSWRDFFDTYSKLIYRTALQAGLNEWEAQEVIQETMIIVAKQMPKFNYDPAIGSFRGWLLRTTRWRIDDQLRKRRHLACQPLDHDSQTTQTSMVARIPDPRGNVLDSHWEHEWRQGVFEAALQNVKRAVSAAQYQIFDLYVVKQWPVEKVASVLKVSPGSVYVAKNRIKPLLEKEIERLKHTLR